MACEPDRHGADPPDMRWVHIHDVFAELAAIKQPSSESHEIGLVVVDWHKKMKQGRADGQAGNSSGDQQPIVGCLAPHDRACGHRRVPVAGYVKSLRHRALRNSWILGGVRGELPTAASP